MKKALLLLLAFGCFAMPGFADETPVAVQPLPALTEAPAMTPVPAEVAVPLGIPQRTFCGERCDSPGASRGCIDASGPVWRRVECICLGGYWTC